MHRVLAIRMRNESAVKEAYFSQHMALMAVVSAGLKGVEVDRWRSARHMMMCGAEGLTASHEQDRHAVGMKRHSRPTQARARLRAPSTATSQWQMSNLMVSTAGLVYALLGMTPVPQCRLAPNTLLRAALSPSMCAPPLIASEIEGMAYRQLQQLCKAHGLGAKGKADELRAKLLEVAGDGSSGSVAAAPPVEASEVEIDEEDFYDDESQLLQEPAGSMNAFDLTGDDANEKTIAEDREGNFDDSLFDELLAELSNENEESYYGEYSAPGTTPSAPAAARSVADPAAGVRGGVDDVGVDDALAALADLDLDLDQPAGAGSGAAAAAASIEGADTFDETWLDDLFGPLDGAPTPGGAAGAAATRRPVERPVGGNGRGNFRPSYQRGGGGGYGASQHDWPGYDIPPEDSDDPNDVLRREILISSRDGNERKCLSSLKRWRKAGLPVEDAVYTASLRACEKAGDWSLASTLINELEESGLPLTSEHFDAALRACDREGRWQEGLVLFERMRSAGLRPTSRSIECVLRNSAKGGQDQMVVMLWDVLKAEMHADPPLQVSTFTYNVLMRALAEGGGKQASDKRTNAAKRVLRAFDEAVDLGLPLDESSYKHALRASDISADWKRAISLLERMQEEGLQPDTLCYGNVMSACGRNGRAQTVLQLMDQMRTQGLRPNAFCYNAAVGAASRAGKWRRAIEIVDDMEDEAVAVNDPTLAPTRHTFTAALKACAFAGRSRPAQSLLKRMERSGFEPDSYHFGTAIDACARSGDMSQV